MLTESKLMREIEAGNFFFETVNSDRNMLLKKNFDRIYRNKDIRIFKGVNLGHRKLFLCAHRK